ncbi:MAG: type II secretion system protein [Sedimentisphaerales bacterium]|nr:type II secretion system protein [Sedimentisphaerales bacterium]
MWYRTDRKQSRRAVTLVELLISMAIMAIVFAAVVPQLRIIQNSWDSKAAAFETIQNGRVLIEHLNRNLAAALRITAVSGPSETNGYIEFMDNDSNVWRYDIDNTSNYVEFGIIGDLYELAGPVSRLLFTCYDGNDFTTTITDVNSIRFVKVQTELTNPAKLDQDMTFSAQTYIRTNALPSPIVIAKLSEPWFEFDTTQGMESALCQIDSTHFLCAYRRVDKGMSSVLNVDTAAWQVSQASTSPFEYESEGGKWPALAKIDQQHYLCAYQFKDDSGHVQILTVDTGNWTISQSDSDEFDTSTGKTPALIRIDQQHYLCAYTGADDDGFAGVLTVTQTDPYTWTISAGDACEFDTSMGLTPALSQIDATHYLCAYTGPGNDGWAVVLIVDTSTWAVSRETPFKFNTSQAYMPALSKIDGTHYLCAYADSVNDGWAVVLTVNTSKWTITKETAFEFEETTGQTPALAQMDQYNYLCAYTGQTYTGQAVILTVNPDDWTISKTDTFQYENTVSSAPTPDLAKIDADHYLCTTTGPADDGFAGVLNTGSILP